MNKKDITYLVLSRKIGESFVIGDDIKYVMSFLFITTSLFHLCPLATSR